MGKHDIERAAFYDTMFVMDLQQLVAHIPTELRDVPGRALYSGRASFSQPSPLYILGLNPGGSPKIECEETVGRSTQELLTELPVRWSAYVDASWIGKAPGTHGLQPRVQHLLATLGRDPRLTPSSNLIFARSQREADLGEITKLIDLCWPFHAAVIDALQIRIVLCFGRTAGNATRQRLSAHTLVDEFFETNQRRWRSSIHKNADRILVVTATHPSIANWTNPKTDPSPMVKKWFEVSLTPDNAGPTGGQISSLYEAAKTGQWDSILATWSRDVPLAQHCAQYHKPSSGWTFLHQAAYFGRHDACRTLIQYGAAIDQRSHDSRTAIDVAHRQAHTDVAVFLEQACIARESLWVPPNQPGLFPSSDRWAEATAMVAQADLRVRYGGGIVRIPFGNRYYVDHCGRVLVGWHGSYNPPGDMDGQSML